MKKVLCGLLISSFLIIQPIGFLMAEENISIEEQVDEQAEDQMDGQIESQSADPLASREVSRSTAETDEATPQLETQTEEQIETQTNTQLDPPLAPQPTRPLVIITEVMIGSEVNPEKDVWVELYNPTEQSITLENWQIKGVTEGGRWIDIVSDPTIQIEPDGYFLLSRYSNSSYSALKIKPEMTKSSLFFMEGLVEIEIRNPEKEVVDQMTIEHQITDEFRSYERVDNEWKKSDQQINLKEGLTKTFATPHAPNGPITKEQIEEITEELMLDPQLSQQLGPPLEIKLEEDPQLSPLSIPQPEIYKNYKLINEIMVNPIGKDTEGEWIELSNNTNELIDLNGWYLDDGDGDSAPYQLKEGTMIGPGARIVIQEPDLKLSLKNSIDTVRLLDPNKEVKESIQYVDVKEGWSYSKKEEGSFEWTPIITPYMVNRFPEPPKSYSSKAITFLNILPNPTGKDEDKEKITLKNNSYHLIDLSQWKLKNKRGKTVNLAEVFLEPYEKVTINPTDSGLTLVNTADELTLIDPTDNVIDQISWGEAKDDEIIFPNNFFQDGIKVNVARVIDGDTLTAIINNEPYDIRLIGVDTPETVHPFEPIEKYGKEASDFLSRTLTGQTITLYFDEEKTDRYNRILAYIHYKEQFINAVLIQKGLGSAYTRYPFKYLDNFVKYEQEAKNNGMGIWSEYETIKFVEDIQENEKEMEEITSNETVEADQDPPIEKIIECPTEGLMIEAILPNSEKGISTEFIQIKNNSDQKICLTGWQLDDNVVKGSKPFTIKGGAISSGGFRNFRKDETNISLNNSNDCGTLISPTGEVVDQICYNKTHQNEIFTHEGGNWEPKKSTPITSAPKVRLVNRTPTPEPIAYQWDLINEVLEGEIVFIYEEGELFYLKNEEQVIPISYAGSDFDIQTSKQLLDFEKPVITQVRTAGKNRQLIGIKQNEPNIKPIQENQKIPTELKYFIGLLIVISGLFGIIKKYQ